MSNPMANKVADIIVDAGGRVVGRTKLQKLAYLLSEAGLETGFMFFYKHYGPYSEGLASATRDARLLGFIREREEVASWGGTYSIFSAEAANQSTRSAVRSELAKIAADSDAVELELAATALFLFKEDCADPWAETERRKPEKAENGRLAKAKLLYQRLESLNTPIKLPHLN